jgi:plasmid stability protein
MQYTVRNIPEYLDAALRRAARRQGKSLNEVAVLALVRGAGLNEQVRKKRDLGDLAGTWHEDAAFDKAVAAQDTIDESMWPSDRDPHKPEPKKRTRKRASAPSRARRKGRPVGTAQ